MHGFYVLVVEDEPLLCCVIAKSLRGFGLDVSEAHTGREALQWLEQIPFDLLISDLKLPDMPGREVLERAWSRDPSLRTMVITAYETEATIQEIPLSRISAVLYKPFDLNLLVSTTFCLLQELVDESSWHAPAEVPTTPERGKAAFPMPCTPPEGKMIRIRAIDQGGAEEIGEQWIGRVVSSHERMFTVLTTCPTHSSQPFHSPRRVQIEYAGADGQYRFVGSVVQVLRLSSGECLWLVRKPTRIQRIQRRHYPRLPATGTVTLALVGERRLRVVTGELVDISEGGMRLCALRGLSDGTRVHALVEWPVGEQLVHFEAEGKIVHGLGRVREAQIKYELGVQLRSIPHRVREQVRASLYQQLTRV